MIISNIKSRKYGVGILLFLLVLSIFSYVNYLTKEYAFTPIKFTKSNFSGQQVEKPDEVVNSLFDNEYIAIGKYMDVARIRNLPVYSNLTQDFYTVRDSDGDHYLLSHTDEDFLGVIYADSRACFHGCTPHSPLGDHLYYNFHSNQFFVRWRKGIPGGQFFITYPYLSITIIEERHGVELLEPYSAELGFIRGEIDLIDKSKVLYNWYVQANELQDQ